MRTRRGFMTVLLAGATGLLVPALARAADRVSVATELDRLTVEVGEAVEFTVQVELEGDGDMPDPVLPNFVEMGLTLAGPPSSFRSSGSSVSFGTGQQTVLQTRAVQTYSYTLIPSKPGRYTLPVHVMNGRTKVAAPRTPVLEVTGSAAPTEPIAGGIDGPTEAQGDLFLWTRLDKSRVYVGEQLVYTLEVYERLPFPNIQLRALPGFQDFWSEELPEGDNRTESVAGVPYRVHPGLRRGLFPQKAGMLTITAAEVGVGMRRRVRGRPTTIEVLPLPVDGRPADFSANNVGLYTIEAAIDRAKIKQGEPFTLTVTISGTGNIRVIDPGAWPELEGMRRYDPKVETRPAVGMRIGGDRIYQFLVIPERAGTLTIPPHRFSFFDPATGRYQTVSSKPIEVAVLADASAPAPSAPAEEAPGPAARPTKSAEDGLLAPLITPDNLPRVASDSAWLTPGRFTAGMILAPTVLAATAGGRALWRRYGPDEASRASAARAAKQRELIAQAERGVATGEGFYPALAQLLQGLALARAGAPGEGLPRRALLELLGRRGAAAPDLERLGRLLDRCDAAFRSPASAARLPRTNASSTTSARAGAATSASSSPSTSPAHRHVDVDATFMRPPGSSARTAAAAPAPRRAPPCARPGPRSPRPRGPTWSTRRSCAATGRPRRGI